MLGLTQAAAEIREGRISSVEYMKACLDRIAAVDPDVQAWAFIDPDYALAQAQARDEHRSYGRTLGPLHGIPIAVKDVFGTMDMPTELGSPLWAGRHTGRDATAVDRLRAAGAVIMGKTVTAEYAYFHPGKTRNPHDKERTPGGSSSGSAAAVGASMVPGAIGTQTNGSTIRPAAYCGVVGFKPTHGMIPRTGCLLLSRTLDHVGLFARSLEDAALLADVLAGFDAGDVDTRPAAAPKLAAAAAGDPPLPPRFAFVKSPAWDRADPDTREAFSELMEELGANASEVELGPSFGRALDLHATIMEADMAHNLRRDYDRGGDKFSERLRGLMERGRTTTAVDYMSAISALGPMSQSLGELFEDYNAIITPAALGEAPRGMATGDPVYCTTWTLLGTPAVTLPLLQSASGMPMGVQLVGARGSDARLLSIANWLIKRLAG